MAVGSDAARVPVQVRDAPAGSRANTLVPNNPPFRKKRSDDLTKRVRRAKSRFSSTRRVAQMAVTLPRLCF